MSDSVRERIFDAIETRLKTITVLAGYKTPFNGKVYRVWQSFDQSALPVLKIVDGGCSPRLAQYGQQFYEMALGIEGVATYTAGLNSAKTADNVLQDIVTSMTSTDKTLGGLCENIELVKIGTVLPDDGSTSVGARVELKVTYATVAGDPYTVATV